MKNCMWLNLEEKKGENTGDQHFLLFLPCIQNPENSLRVNLIINKDFLNEENKQLHTEISEGI